MELAKFSDYFKLLPLIFPLSLLCALSGSRWIDSLYTRYTKGQEADLLSFPEQVSQRSRFRKPLLFLLLLLLAGRVTAVAAMPAAAYFTVAVTLLSFITVTDFEQYVIFDAMLLPLAIAGVFYTLHLQLPLTEHLAAALGGGLLFFLLAVATHGAIGGGDIKLVAALGLWLGVRPLLSVIAYGFMAGGAAALFLLLTKQKDRRSYFAYGPYFALSAVAILLGWVKGLF